MSEEKIIDKYITLKKLQQENKQLKEQLDVHKILLQTNAPSTCILTELEEWCKSRIDKVKYNSFDDILDKIQKLKEKYK